MELTLNKYKEMRVKREENQTFERENLYVERQGRKTNGCVPFFTELFPITQKTRQKFHERTENREENNFLLLSNFKTMDYYLFFFDESLLWRISFHA